MVVLTSQQSTCFTQAVRKSIGGDHPRKSVTELFNKLPIVMKAQFPF
jgi:hypothetical protein